MKRPPTHPPASRAADGAGPIPGTLYHDFCQPPGYSVYYAVLEDGALAFRIEMPTKEVTPERLELFREIARAIAGPPIALVRP